MLQVESSSINNPNRDLHLFASNALSVRVATSDMDMKVPAVNPPSHMDLRLTVEETEHLKAAYSVLV